MNQMMMMRRLYEASLQGNINSLMELLGEDPLILERVITSFSETPLHIASMFGHVDFAIELLTRKPEFASELDSEGFSPLHFASSRKNIEMVKILLMADPNVCNLTDKDGRTPLHLAAMNGRVEVMKELITTRPETIGIVSNRGETILHLCVKHNRFESLKLLIQMSSSSSFDISMMNAKDGDGNTILHLSVAKKHMELIKFLIQNYYSSNIGMLEVNALNKNGFTALDILITHSSRDLNDIEINEFLRSNGVLRAKELQPSSTTSNNNNNNLESSSTTTTTTTTTDDDDHHNKTSLDKKYKKWLKEKTNTLMVVASLIATMAFQAGANPSGGYWQDDRYPNNYLQSAAGRSIMATNYPRTYFAHMIYNTIGFLASLSIILLLISGLPFNRRFFVWILTVIMWVAITCMALTYHASLYMVTPPYISSIHEVLTVSFVGWFGLMGFVVLMQLYRLISRFLIK